MSDEQKRSLIQGSLGQLNKVAFGDWVKVLTVSGIAIAAYLVGRP